MAGIQANDVGDLLRGRMGLIVGPGTTSSPRLFAELTEVIASEFNVSTDGTCFNVADRAIVNVGDETLVQRLVRSYLDNQRPPATLSHFAKANWAAILSASLDLNLETRVQQESERRALRRPVTTVNDFSSVLPPRTIPSWKLLGSYTRDDFCFSNVQYLRKRPTWRHGVRGFWERTRGNPVLCVGMAACPWILHDLLAEMIAEPSASGSSILLFSDDPLLNDRTLAELTRTRFRLLTVQGGVSELVRSVTSAEKASFGRKLPFREESDSEYANLAQFDDFVSIVNSHLEPSIDRTENNRLVDSLFSPASVSWEPYHYGLDLPRDACRQLHDAVKEAIAQNRIEPLACVLSGSAATGKTTVQKRVAFDLAKDGHLVLWFRQLLHTNTAHLLDSLFRGIADIELPPGRSAVAFIDDPMAFGSVSPAEIASISQSHGVDLIIVVGARTSDWAGADRSSLMGHLSITSEIALSDVLSEFEWAQLPDYLLSLGIASTHEAAKEQVSAAAGRAARDTLCTLYFLLPSTKSSIVSSVRDEYFRLGDIAGLKKAILGTESATSGILREAYEMVAIAETYRAPLPIEVLIAALNVGYDTWLSSTPSSGAAWGLLYSEESEQGDTICYRTRNQVVTQLIVEAVNGGAFGHSGELAVLLRLLRACSGRASSVYREFCIKILVPHHELDHLEYAEGQQLYEAARSALPYPDKTLAHHASLWTKNRGQDPLKAEDQLRVALTTPQYPYAAQQESQEHIYTSLAATALDSVDSGKRTLDEGKQVVLGYLDKARRANDFDPRPVHVQANLIIRLAKKVDQSDGADNADFFALINRAVTDVDRTLLVLRNPVADRRHRGDDVRLLEDARERVLLAIKDTDELKRHAIALWHDHSSQEGFVLVARKLYQAAQASNRGKDFRKADDYCIFAMRKVTNSEMDPSESLLEVTLHNYYSWRVVRGLYSGAEQSIDWIRVQELIKPLVASRNTGDIAFYRYVYALVLCHMNHWREADAVFAKNRSSGLPTQVLWAPRGYLLDDRGKPKLIQGTVRVSDHRAFFHAEDLGTDFYTRRGSRIGSPGEIAHAYLEISFGAARAVEPQELDL